jgi:hypothetical protein
MEAPPSPLSLRAKRRDLQFSGPLVEMFFRPTDPSGGICGFLFPLPPRPGTLAARAHVEVGDRLIPGGRASVGRRGWWSMTVDFLVSVTERVPVILHQRRGNRRITEPRVAIDRGGRSLGDVMACCLHAIMVALFGSLRVCRRRRWWVVRGRLRMGTSRQGKRNQQYGHREQSLHDVSSEKGTHAPEKLLRACVKKENRMG